MTDNTNPVKTRADRIYKHATMARHRGKVIAFAMDDRRRIGYTMPNTSSQNGKRAFSRKVDPHPVR